MISVFRLFSLAFLTWHFALYFPSLAEPAVLVFITAAGFIGGYVSSSLRLWVSALAAAAAYLGLRLLLVGAPEIAAGFWSTGTPLDGIPLWSDRQLTFGIPGFAVAWLQGWWNRSNRPALGAERLVNAALLAALFWAQGPYHITLYAYPLELGLALLLFLASETVVLLGGKATVSRKTAAAFAGLAAVVIAVASLLWGLFGKYEELSTAAGGGLMKPDLFQFDFSSLVRLESEISLSDHLVLLYREPGPGAKRYLRRFVLSGYDPAKGFFVEPTPGGSEEATPPVGRQTLHFPANERWSQRTVLSQEYFLVNLDPSSLLALNAPVLVQPYAKWDKSSFVNAYHVESRVTSDLYWEINDETRDGLTDAERAHDLNYGNDPELKALALSITATAGTPYEKAYAVQNWLKDHYFYSLKPGVPGPEGSLKHFLFGTKKGYCSYFAFSMALLLRSVGIPARVSVGFITNPEEKLLDFYPVRAFQAHAWVEVPFGDFGWIDFDPTSETLAPGEDFTTPKSMDRDEMTRMISEILNAKPQPLNDQPVEEARTTEQGFSLAALQAWSARNGWLVVLALLVVFQEVYRRRFYLRALVSAPRSRVEQAWRHLRWRAQQSGRGPVGAQTPLEWAQTQALPALQTWMPHLERARYARDFSADEAAQAWKEFRALDAAVAQFRSPGRRLLFTVLPWWPTRSNR